MFKDEIVNAIKKATGEEVVLDVPEMGFGDYSTNIALKKGSPREFAEELKQKLEDVNLNCVEKIEIAGPGFINFYLKKEVLLDNLKEIQKKKEKYGHSNRGEGETVVIDYSAPNIAKSFSIGHLRSTIIGQALYNLYKTIGYNVIGDNHLGDWGTQFGKLIYMIKREGVEDFDIGKLEELYVKFHDEAEDPAKAEVIEKVAREWFKKLEDGDSEAKRIWQKCKDISLSEFNRIYKLLGVSIDYAYGESFYEGVMKEMLEDPSIKKHLSKGDEGATIVDLSDQGLKTPLMFLKKDGATTYATRDLATLLFRKKTWNPTIVIYEVGNEQALHFQQVFAAAKKLGIVSDNVRLYHVGHGLYLNEDGKKFRTRKGGTVKLEDVLKEAVEKAANIASQKGNDDKNVAEKVGIGAIKYYDLMHSPQSDIVFNWENIMNLEGNSGPYLQYTSARTNSVLEKSGKNLEQFNPTQILNSDEEEILRALVHYPEVLEEAALKYSPNLLASYLYNLASKYNKFYAAHKIISGENEETDLALTFAVGQVLENGLNILGVEPLKRM